jgi:hypothetical protein
VSWGSRNDLKLIALWLEAWLQHRDTFPQVFQVSPNRSAERLELFHKPTIRCHHDRREDRIDLRLLDTDCDQQDFGQRIVLVSSIRVVSPWSLARKASNFSRCRVKSGFVIP